MANVDVVNLNGEKVGTVELADEVFAASEVNEALLWEAVKHYRAAMRQGTHATKNRKLVAGSARNSGSRREPVVRVSARCALLCGVMAARSTDLSRAATITPSPARSCWAHCARRWLRSWPTASSRLWIPGDCRSQDEALSRGPGQAGSKPHHADRRERQDAVGGAFPWSSQPGSCRTDAQQ